VEPAPPPPPPQRVYVQPAPPPPVVVEVGPTPPARVYVERIAPPPPPPPVYAPAPVYAPPPVYMPPRLPLYAPLPRLKPRPVFQAPRGPVVGMGARFSMLGVSSQQVFGQNVNLYGGGLFMRFRNQGHFGFELGMDAMRASINNDAFVRTSYPFTVAPMLYLFQNRPDNHFNIYAIAGFGLMAADIGLYKGTSQERNQQFWEFMAQAGGGIELRFNRLALFADARAIAMALDNSSGAGVFYQNVMGGPVPGSSGGYKLNLGAMLWF